MGPAACSIISFSALRLADLRLGVRAGRGRAGIGGAALAAARCRARRRRPEHQEQLGGQHQENQGQGWPPPRQRCSPSGQGQSRDERARCATSRIAQRPGAGTIVLGVHGLTGRCECARCVTWGSSLPDGDPKILVGRTRNRGFSSGIPDFFPAAPAIFEKKS